MSNTKARTTDFGFETIDTADKTKRVSDVFKAVADNYDLMNDLMSLGIHRAWKHFAINMMRLSPGLRVLDLAGGTGDLTAGIASIVGVHGEVTLADINSAMLQVGRKRLIDLGIYENVRFVQTNAEQLAFEPNYFDRIIIGFGIRNVTDKLKALQSMFNVIKPGCFLTILEFSKPNNSVLKSIYDQYSFKLLPWLGKKIANDEASYRYLVESIRMHPDQQALCTLMRQAGFEDCSYHNLSGGIVAVHKGYKY